VVCIDVTDMGVGEFNRNEKLKILEVTYSLIAEIMKASEMGLDNKFT
jgi:hypothetical protein